MNPYRHLTILGIIALAAIVFVGEQIRSNSYAAAHGTVPAVVVGAFRALLDGEASISVFGALAGLVTSLFLHGSLEHILLNMVFLWTFGYLASQILGQLPALVIFLFCGMCGNIAQVLLNIGSSIPIIGASGAVCGLEGVYLGLGLRWHLRWPDVWPLAYPIPPLQLGAFAVLGFVGDMYFLANQYQSIAYGAHVGGFISGLAAAALVSTAYPTIENYQRKWLR